MKVGNIKNVQYSSNYNLFQMRLHIELTIWSSLGRVGKLPPNRATNQILNFYFIHLETYSLNYIL